MKRQEVDCWLDKNHTGRLSGNSIQRKSGCEMQGTKKVFELWCESSIRSQKNNTSILANVFLDEEEILIQTGAESGRIVARRCWYTLCQLDEPLKWE